MTRNEDQLLLDAVPSYLSITQMLKATPLVDGGRRFIYMEASNEGLDLQGERVLAKALADSAGYFLRFGNLDLDHFTQIGAPNAQKGWPGIPDYQLYEVGMPADVASQGQSTLVKGEIYSGTGAAAERANAFWDSLTCLSPPARWYPSVGGAVPETAKAVELDKDGNKRVVVKAVRWTNIGFSKTPVNPHLGTVGTVPFGALAKSMCIGGGWDFSKALEAGYGTDSASLAGGGALRKQSLDGHLMSYLDFRDVIAEYIRGRKGQRRQAD